MNSLTVHLQRSENDAAEMTIEVDANGFSGHGSAWFSLAGLERSLAAFEEFPISADRRPLIAGGDWNDDASKLLKERVHISVKPLGGLGQLVMTVKAIESIHDYEVRDMGFSVCTDLLIDYSELGEFVSGMRELIAGTLPTLRLEFPGSSRERVG
jgi:hypothetical protein